MSKFTLKAMWIALSVLALVILLAGLSWWAVKELLYVPQTVTVARVETLCSVEWRNRLPFRRHQTAWMSDCQSLALRMKKEDFGRGERLRKDMFLSFFYISPADGKRHPGTLKRIQNDQDQPARRGDRIVIHASRLMPGIFTDWWSSSIAVEDMETDRPDEAG